MSTLPPDAPSTRLKVFLSYSPSKGSRPEVVNRTMEIVAAAVQSRGLEVVDPMRLAQDEVGIRAKVESALMSCQAIIADCTVSAPNVIYEVAFSRALGNPAILLVNPEAFRDPALQEYFEFIGHTRNKPFAADMGDAEWCEYPDSVPHGDWTDFQERIAERVERLASAWAPARIVLAKSQRDLAADLRGRTEVSKGDSALLHFASAWLEQVVDDLSRVGSKILRVESEYYPGCLKRWRAWGNVSKARAIAELSDDVERFWDTEPEAESTRLRERIFLVPWRTFFDNQEFGRIIDFLTKHAEVYDVRVAAVPELRLANHPLGQQGYGWDILLIEPDVVGGYVTQGDRTLLHIERDENTFEAAQELYKRVHVTSVRIDRKWTARDARSAWLKLHRYGYWNPHWEDVLDRDAYYFEHYDKHIRCWIPRYEELVTRTCESVQAGVHRMVLRGALYTPTDRRGLTVLEIGPGTGAVTSRLLAWFASLSRPFEGDARVGDARVIDRYVALDKSRQMIDMARASVSDREPGFTVNWKAQAFEQFASTCAPETFDVICGSLVLHDLLGASAPLEKLEALLRTCSRMLRPGGTAVFADGFFHRGDIGTQELEKWRLAMKKHGLPVTEVTTFLDHNAEMINTVPVEDISDVAARNGFARCDVVDVNAPFRIIELEKDWPSS